MWLLDIILSMGIDRETNLGNLWLSEAYCHKKVVAYFLHLETSDSCQWLRGEQWQAKVSSLQKERSFILEPKTT